jgi:hypothetical protein
MRPLLFSLALLAAPAAAQTAPAQTAPSQTAPKAQQRPADTAEITRVLNDPAMAQKMTNVLQALSGALLEMPVGEVEAALDGRKPTAADKKRTVREVGREEDPNFERDLKRDLAESGPMMQSAMKALAGAMPAMMKGLEEAGRAMERATANMPSPAYPKR